MQTIFCKIPNLVIFRIFAFFSLFCIQYHRSFLTILATCNLWEVFISGTFLSVVFFFNTIGVFTILYHLTLEWPMRRIAILDKLQNLAIFGILGVFFNRFWHRTTQQTWQRYFERLSHIQCN